MEYDLAIREQSIRIGGRDAEATLINGTLPGPLLRMREGTDVTLRVTNHLKEVTSIHWHGLLLPPGMDGVPGVSFTGIKPGETFTYRFPVKQSGTYWYHSHSGAQEQLGIFGPLIIDPVKPEPFQYDRDYIIMLSDWTFKNPHRLLAKLKNRPGYFNFQRRTMGDFAQDVLEQGLKSTVLDRLDWAQMRMDPTDIADITSYEYSYLLNGLPSETNWTALFKPGERVRLRFINAAAATYFDVRIPGLPMTVVQADGQNVQPVTVEEFRMAIAETYDVIIQPKEDRAYTIFAETMDRSGYTRGTLATRQGMSAPIPAKRPRPLATMADMGMGDMAGMKGMDAKKGADGMKDMNETKETPSGDMPGMNHAQPAPMKTPDQMSGMAMPGIEMEDQRKPSGSTVKHGPDHHGSGNSTVAMNSKSRLDEPGMGLENSTWRVLVYSDLRSLKPDSDTRPAEREIELHLTGNMDRFMWGFDGKKFSEGEPIKFHYGERVRLTLVNDTMMNHPIHLHGMFMDLDNGTGAFKPKKHTINVKPAERVSLDITVDAPGNWAFHCHILYHMEMGMFRIVSVFEKKADSTDTHSKPTSETTAVVANVPAIKDGAEAETQSPPGTVGKNWPSPVEDHMWFGYLLFDQLEYRLKAGDDTLRWDVAGWYGGDYNRFWFKTEGDWRTSGERGGEAEAQALYGRLIAPFWDVQVGVRYDQFSGADFDRSRVFAVIGLQGLAPYRFEVEPALFVSQDGDVSARLTATYDMLLTQRLILQPRLDLDAAVQTVEKFNVGKGVNSIGLGLRLRYEIRREFAPYVGIHWLRRLGETADISQREGGRVEDIAAVFGVRLWF